MDCSDIADLIAQIETEDTLAYEVSFKYVRDDGWLWGWLKKWRGIDGEKEPTVLQTLMDVRCYMYRFAERESVGMYIGWSGSTIYLGQEEGKNLYSLREVRTRKDGSTILVFQNHFPSDCEWVKQNQIRFRPLPEPADLTYVRIRPIPQNAESTLEKKVSVWQWLKNTFHEEWPTMGNHAIAVGSSVALAAGCSALATLCTASDAAIAGIGTMTDVVGYWGTFIPQLAFRDRDKLKNQDGHYTTRKILKKVTEYLGYVTVLEGVYVAARWTGQYWLQKRGWDPVNASTAIQLGGATAFTFLLPIVRYAARQWSEK